MSPCPLFRDRWVLSKEIICSILLQYTASQCVTDSVVYPPTGQCAGDKLTVNFAHSPLFIAYYYEIALNSSAPGYLASDLQRVSDLGARRRLRSSTTSALVAPRTVHATIGDRAFPAAAASVWNSLPETVRSSPSLPVFRSRLKTELFARSYSCSD